MPSACTSQSAPSPSLVQQISAQTALGGLVLQAVAEHRMKWSGGAFCSSKAQAGSDTKRDNRGRSGVGERGLQCAQAWVGGGGREGGLTWIQRRRGRQGGVQKLPTHTGRVWWYRRRPVARAGAWVGGVACVGMRWISRGQRAPGGAHNSRRRRTHNRQKSIGSFVAEDTESKGAYEMGGRGGSGTILGPGTRLCTHSLRR